MMGHYFDKDERFSVNYAGLSKLKSHAIQTIANCIALIKNCLHFCHSVQRERAAYMEHPLYQ